jgi:riboflavin synthase
MPGLYNHGGRNARPLQPRGRNGRPPPPWENVSVFTGIVREVGVVETADGGAEGVRIRLRAPETAAGASVGDSVALNGVCLTVTEVDGDSLAFDAVPETLRRTSLGRLRAGGRVNVEPALRAGEPLGGHIVQGHADGLGRVRALAPEGQGLRVEVEAPPEILRYGVEKGSITVEGVSLTIAALGEDAFQVALIPHTLEATTLGTLGPGDAVNLEVDVLAKYVERLLAGREAGVRSPHVD